MAAKTAKDAKQAEITTLDAHITTLQTEIAAMSDGPAKTAKEDQLAAMNTTKTTMTTDLATLNTTFTTLDGEWQTAETTRIAQEANDFKQEQLAEWNAAKAERDAEKTYLDELTAEVAEWQALKNAEADLELWREYDKAGKAAKERLEAQQGLFDKAKNRFDEVDGAKSDREQKEQAEADAAAFKTAYDARETELAGFNTTITTLKTAIAGIDTDIAAQQAIIDAGSPGEAAHDAAVTAKATLEATKATKVAE